MFCIANMLGLYSCKSRLNPSRGSFVSRIISYLFCFCEPPKMKKLDDPVRIEAALAKAKTKFNKEKREREKKLKQLKKDSAIIIQKAYKKYRLIQYIYKYIALFRLAATLSPLIKFWKVKHVARKALRRARFEQSMNRQKLGCFVWDLLRQAKAIRLGEEARQDFKSRRMFIIKLQASIRRYMSSKTLQDLRWQQREINAKLRPAMSSPLFSYIAFKKTADLDLMDHIIPVVDGTKIYIKSDLLSFPKGIPHLSQQTFEKNFPNLHHTKGIYFPRVWIIDSFLKHTVPVGLYCVHFDSNHNILPIKFTSTWNGEIVVYVTKQQEIKLKRTFNSTKRPLQTTGQPPKLDFGLLQQLAFEDKAEASRSGLNVCAPAFEMAPKSESSLRFEPYIVQKKNQLKKKARRDYFYLPMPTNYKSISIVPFCILGDHIFLNKSL
uniref:Uncharacterized protein n=1 Tax=Rhizoctonia cerealis hypovirus TaxID=3068667 RepID=A0AA51BSA2_9VIRU|nr:MAG: hypothetical protein [Rhizoctonia cerealis hypovirus]